MANVWSSVNTRKYIKTFLTHFYHIQLSIFHFSPFTNIEHLKEQRK